jgi:DNA (cytosine-5)-methyltransferase 1
MRKDHEKAFVPSLSQFVGDGPYLGLQLRVYIDIEGAKLMKPIQAVDLFCGAGGTSTGLMAAARHLDLDVKLTAINHWDVAIETHSRNHPGARHLCESLDGIEPRKLFPDRRLRLLVASPECTHFSIARGGVPCSDQSRSSAWQIVRWAEALYIDNILIENVPEFVSWGPLGVDGKPLPSMRGKTFRAFTGALESLGYRCSWRIVNTADFGDPTCRTRFFMICRRGNKRIQWPDHTHSEQGGKDLFGETRKWVPAWSVIDWSIEGESIFNRKKPLARRSMDRIIHGLKTFGGKNAEPFLVMLYGTSKSRSTGLPLPTITASGQHIALCEPFILPQQTGRAGQLYVRSVTKPMSTVATRGADALIEPFIIKYYGTAKNALSVEKPIGTITTRDRFGLVSPTMNRCSLDIRYRMLQPHELAAAQSFPPDYHFCGNKSERIKQIGNAVPVKTAEALCRALLKP